MDQIGLNLIELVQTCSNLIIKLDQIGSMWFKMNEIGSKLIKLAQNGSNWFKLDSSTLSSDLGLNPF